MRVTLALIFFLSGASALVFEALWFRLAGLSLGNSVWSASLVLAAFMGGLALGNGLVARLHRRIRQPVRIYAGLEFAIGIGGIGVVLLLPHLPALLGPMLGTLTELPLLLNTVRVSVAFTILLLPAIAMGATLPVLAQALTRHDPNFGANIGWLYGWNTLGAMLGALGTELLLVPAFGVFGTGLVAMSFNLVAGLIALRVSQEREAGIATAAEELLPTTLSPRSRRFLAVAFLSGALMLALEVVWFRFLLLTRDGTSLIFGVMLAVVLAGIAIGGLVAGQLFRRDVHAYRWLRHVTAASAALVVLTYWGYDLFAVYEDTRDRSMLEFAGLALFLMFPVAFLSGVAFTMVNRAVKDELGASARAAGIATLYNTVGAMLGSLAGGFVLLPVVGMERSFFIVAAAYLTVTFLVPSEARASRQAVMVGRAAIAIAVLSLVVFPFGLMKKTYFDSRLAWLPTHELVAAREGLVETLRYYQREVFGEPKYYRLVTNGYSMSATTTAAKRYMKLYVYLPLALKPDTEDVLLVSYGVGSTAKALTDSSGLKRVDVVDISEEILEMSSVIYPGDDNPLADERVHVHVEDGRFFLNTTSHGYDLITSEPPPPKIAGVVNLYSQEYFELIRSRLNRGGFASYWLPVEQLEPGDALAIVKAFCNAFDDCSLWTGAGLEWMLLGSNDATRRPHALEFAAQWRDPNVHRELISLGFEAPAQLGSLFMADAALLDELTADVLPVTDNFPSRISSTVVQNRHVELYDRLMDEDERRARFRDSALIDRLWPADLRDESERYFAFERLIKNHFTGGAYRAASDPYFWQALDDVLTNSTLTTLPLWLLGSDQASQDIVARRLDGDGGGAAYALELAKKYTSQRDFETALEHATTYVTATRDVPLQASNLYLYLLAKNGRAEQARPVLTQLAGLGQPNIDRFVDWYAERFGVGVAGSRQTTAATAAGIGAR